MIFSIFGVFYLLHSGQGEELTSSLVLVPSSGSWLLFISIAAWSAQCWLWSSLAIALDSDDKEPDVTLLDGIVPLILATIVFLIALEPFIRTEQTGVISLIGISCFCMFVVIARWLLQSSEPKSKGSSRDQTGRTPVGSFFDFTLDIDPDEELQFAKFRNGVIVSLTGSVVCLVLGSIFTLELGKLLGTLGIVFLASAILLPFVAGAAISARRTNFPVLWVVLLAPFLLPSIYSRLLHLGWPAVIASILLIAASGVYFFQRRPLLALVLLSMGGSLAFLSYYGSQYRFAIPHEVDKFTASPPVKRCTDAKGPACISTLQAEIDAWLAVSNNASQKKTNYVIFVAAAGGGLRAGYWTASVLARLNDCIPDFNNRLFAISGVSGGSLGAGLYTALVRNGPGGLANTEGSRLRCPDHPTTISDPAAFKTPLQSQLTDFLEKDFLAPVAASLFFRDLPQALIPVQFIPDRAAILERAFDQAWTDACALRSFDSTCREPLQFSKSFLGLRGAGRWTPLLFLNGTHEETGKRIITSYVGIDQGTFYDAFDFFDLVGSDISLSTAVMNSARFPFVSPAGALTKSGQDQSIMLNGHIIDGGFFENNGATTLQEVVDATMTYLKSKRPLDQWRPLIIEIVNDVEAQGADLDRRKNELFPKRPDEPLEPMSRPYEETEFANQLFSAVTGLYATRTARGILASKMLSDLAVRKNGYDGEFVQFRLCPHMRPSPPLGWLLTAQSRKAMDQLILGVGRSVYQEHYVSYLDAKALSEFKNCFDDVQQNFVKIKDFLNQ